jgi:hypothetical protein
MCICTETKPQILIKVKYSHGIIWRAKVIVISSRILCSFYTRIIGEYIKKGYCVSIIRIAASLWAAQP